MGITSRYVDGSLDPTFSILDERKVAAQQKVRPYIDRPIVQVVTLADEYLKSGGSKNVGACLNSYFTKIARAHSLEGAASDADFYYSDWNITALAIAYLKARSYLDKSRTAGEMKAWFERSADRLAAFHERQRAMGKVNNHLYWGGLAITSSSLVTGNSDHLAYGRRILDIGLSGIDQNGHLKAELARGTRARHYHLFAASPLAALIIMTGTHLSLDQEKRFQTLIRAIVSSLADPKGGEIARISGPQIAETRWSDLLLLQPFVASDAKLTATIRKLTMGKKDSQLYLGGDLTFLRLRYRTSSPK